MSSQADLWINKYKPTKVADLISNKAAIKEIKKWLRNYSKGKTKHNSIIVSGNHGIGKSVSIELVLKESHFTIKRIKPENLKGKDAVDNLIQSVVHCGNIYEIMLGKKKTKYALVIDATDTITLRSEKACITQLYKENEKKRYFPIIFISNLQHNKLISDIKKNCTEITFKNPTENDMKRILSKVVKNEKMVIDEELKSKVMSKIIKFSQNDIRRMIYILQDLHYSHKNKSITIDHVKKYLNFSQKKNKDIGLFDATRKILEAYHTVDKSLILYETEKVLLPLMIHENYYKVVLSRNNINTLNTMKTISENISKGDVIETNIYTDQNWYLQDIYGFYTCVQTSYSINKNTNKFTPRKKYGIKFSSDLNKTSLKNINRKNIVNIQQVLPNKSIYDILNINKLLYHMVKNKKFEEIGKLVKDYKLSIKDIEVIIKIDKTKEKLPLSSKGKKCLGQCI